MDIVVEIKYYIFIFFGYEPHILNKAVTRVNLLSKCRLLTHSLTHTCSIACSLIFMRIISGHQQEACFRPQDGDSGHRRSGRQPQVDLARSRRQDCRPPEIRQVRNKVSVGHVSTLVFLTVKELEMMLLVCNMIICNQLLNTKYILKYFKIQILSNI